MPASTGDLRCLLNSDLNSLAKFIDFASHNAPHTHTHTQIWQGAWQGSCVCGGEPSFVVRLWARQNDAKCLQNAALSDTLQIQLIVYLISLFCLFFLFVASSSILLSFHFSFFFFYLLTAFFFYLYDLLSLCLFSVLSHFRSVLSFSVLQFCCYSIFLLFVTLPPFLPFFHYLNSYSPYHIFFFLSLYMSLVLVENVSQSKVSIV